MFARSLYIVSLWLLCAGIAHGQTPITSSILMRGEVSQDKVALRWAPTDARCWRLLNKYGVQLERLTVWRDGEVLTEPEVVDLSGSIKPEASDELIQIATDSPYGAIIAQAVFGETFELTGAEKGDIATIIALDDELQQRYVVSMYAADLCFPAALAVGWGWEDERASKNERYLYRVKSLVPQEEGQIASGSLFVDTQRKEKFPKPLEFYGNFGDEMVELSWNYRTLQELYNTYFIERSTDGKRFEPISELPITELETSAIGQVTYFDTISNEVTYHYRIIGTTPFGTRGEYSDTVSGRGASELKSSPFITKAIPDEHGGAVLEWDFPTEDEGLITRFSLERSQDDRTFEVLIDSIERHERSLTLPALLSTNYFVLVAHANLAKTTRSLSVLLQAIDTLPPAQPKGLRVLIDTSGVSQLSWMPNEDADIFGYRIYRGLTEGEELIPLTDVAVRDTVFSDSVNLNLLNHEVFYALTALDERYNQSDLSDVVRALKPETIPPTPPLITRIEVESGKNTLFWVSGGEPTLNGYDLYRSAGDAPMELLTTVEFPDVDSFEDGQLEHNRIYRYQVVSRTQGGLVSKPSLVYSVKAINRVESKALRIEFVLTPREEGVKLSWKTTSEEEATVQLYKKKQDEAFELYRDGMDAVWEWVDKEVIPGVTYHYMIVVRTSNASPLAVTKTIAL